MARQTRLNHDAVTSPENIWARDPHGDSYSDRYRTWWLHTYYGEANQRGLGSKDLIRRIFGRQTMTVTFMYRNWVWHDPDAGWTLYVDLRGASFYVQNKMNAQDAWDAFVKFRDQVDTWLKENPR